MEIFEEKKKLKLTDLVDLNFLQKCQDTFAETTGMASIIVDDYGSITKSSNFTDFCLKYTRGSEIGLKRCIDCDIKWGKIAAGKGEPVIYDCHVGLTDFAVPIIVDDKHIASILGGQILTKEPDEVHFRNLSKELGVNEEEYLEALKKIKIVPRKTVESAANLLFLFANFISQIAHQNYELLQKNSKNKILINTIEVLRSKLEPEEIKKYFIEIASKYFEPDRCLFVDYDREKGKFLPFSLEKLKTDDIQSLIGVDIEVAFPEFCQKLKIKQRNIIVKDLEKTISRKKLLSYEALKSLESSSVKSDYGLVVEYNREIMGILILHYIKEKRILNREEFGFLKTLRDNAGTALHQAELYEKINQIAKKEYLLRKIIESVHSNLNINQTKKNVVEEISKVFNANRVFILEFDENVEEFKPLNEFSEYLTPGEKSLVGYNFNSSDVEFIADMHRKNEPVITQNFEKFIEQNNLRGTSVENWFREFDIKAGVGFPIFYEDKILAILAIHYTKPTKELTQDVIDFFHDVSEQIGIALYQAKLYEKSLKQAQRESLISEVLTKSISTFDINEIRHIVKKIGIMTKADRCYLVEVDLKKMKGKPIDYEGEYTSSKDIKSIVGYEFSSEDVKKFIELFINANDLIFFDYEKIKETDDPKYSGIKRYSQIFELKSGVGIPFISENKLKAVLAVEYIKEKITPSKEELNFLRIVGNQTGMVFNQIQLYQSTKQQAERETLLRSITEAIRSTLDFDETKQIIVDILGKTLNADRCYIAEYDEIRSKFFIIEDEYLSSADIVSYKGVDVNKELPHFVNIVKKGNPIIIQNKQITLKDNVENLDAEERMIEKYKINSAYAFPLFYKDELLGAFSIHYVRTNKKITEDEIEFLKLLATQIALAIYQSRLYKRVQQQAERERISRNIIEILRSTLDKKIIKNLFVKNIGKYFGADRVLFSEYNPKINAYSAVDSTSEYLSNLDEQSLVGYDWSNSEIQNYMQPILDKREIKIPNWEEYYLENFVNPEIVELYKNSKLKSKYNFPVLYEGSRLGFFSIEFTQKIYELSDEDLSRIRSICTQAGIAIHHAELYLKAQDALKSKEEIISRVKKGVQVPVENILENSKLLFELEIERDKQKEYLNNIINSCNELLDLTKNINGAF